MQQAPVMKGSGLKPVDDGKSGDKPTHVFGSNLQDRVVTEDTTETSKTISFSSTPAERVEDDIETIRKRKFDAITGEEDEETAFQGDFKLFAWDLATSNWIEKGRGQLKLNDSLDEDGKRSRIIMRVGGTLKIVLNVAIKHSTFRVITSSKTSIRFTDSQTVWAASGSNASLLKELIDERLEIAKEEDEKKGEKRSKKDDSVTNKKEDSEAAEDGEVSEKLDNSTKANDKKQNDVDENNAKEEKVDKQTVKSGDRVTNDREIEEDSGDITKSAEEANNGEKSHCSDEEDSEDTREKIPNEEGQLEQQTTDAESNGIDDGTKSNDDSTSRR